MIDFRPFETLPPEQKYPWLLKMQELVTLVHGLLERASLEQIEAWLVSLGRQPFIWPPKTYKMLLAVLDSMLEDEAANGARAPVEPVSVTDEEVAEALTYADIWAHPNDQRMDVC
jgi:hypothetical protein